MSQLIFALTASFLVYEAKSWAGQSTSLITCESLVRSYAEAQAARFAQEMDSRRMNRDQVTAFEGEPAVLLSSEYGASLISKKQAQALMHFRNVIQRDLLATPEGFSEKAASKLLYDIAVGRTACPGYFLREVCEALRISLREADSGLKVDSRFLNDNPHGPMVFALAQKIFWLKQSEKQFALPNATWLFQVLLKITFVDSVLLNRLSSLADLEAAGQIEHEEQEDPEQLFDFEIETGLENTAISDFEIESGTEGLSSDGGREPLSNIFDFQRSFSASTRSPEESDANLLAIGLEPLSDVMSVEARLFLALNESLAPLTQFLVSFPPGWPESFASINSPKELPIKFQLFSFLAQRKELEGYRIEFSMITSDLMTWEPLTELKPINPLASNLSAQEKARLTELLSQTLWGDFLMTNEVSLREIDEALQVGDLPHVFLGVDQLKGGGWYLLSNLPLRQNFLFALFIATSASSSE